MGCVLGTFRVGPASGRYSTQYYRIIQRYLPHFVFDAPSTREDQLVAFQHWDRVFKEKIVGDAHHHTSDTMIGQLYLNFYAYLFKYYSYLKPLFRASVEVQSRVIVHISSGMESLLLGEDLVHQVLNLSLVHMNLGVTANDFDPLGESLIQAMRLTCGDDWDERVETAWRRIYCHVAVLILFNIPSAKADLDI